MKNTPEVPENTTSPGIKAKFVLLSLIGIFMFFVPVPSNGATTIPIEYLVSFLTGHFMAAGRLYALAVILIATAMPFIKKTWNKDAITTIFTFTKILGAVFTVIVFSGVGPEPIMRADHGPFLFESLAVQVGTLIPIGAIFLTCLMNYGFIDFAGQFLRPLMRAVWRTPGRSAVDAVASFMGSTAVGMLITNEMYKERKYNTREASIIATGFSTVCVSFFVIVAKTADCGESCGDDRGFSRVVLPLFVHFICNQHSHGRTSHEGGHGVDGRAPRGPPDCPHQGAEELAGKVNKTIIHKTGQKDGADWNKSSHLDCQRFEEEGPVIRSHNRFRSDAGKDDYREYRSQYFCKSENGCDGVFVPGLFYERHGSGDENDCQRI